MTYGQRVEKAKPYLTGFIVGLVAAPIIAFSAGWVSTSGARAEAVQNARIDTLAGVCSNSVQKAFATESKDLATLKGWDNRAVRDDVVAKTMANIEVPKPLVSAVSNGCSATLA
jgi:hypothetical protein